jgi:hypothetical protein
MERRKKRRRVVGGGLVDLSVWISIERVRKCRELEEEQEAMVRKEENRKRR